MTTGERPMIRVVSAEIQRDGCYLITRRPPHAVLPDLWEFPGGKVASDEDDVGALNRALTKRIGCTAAVGDRLLEVRHTYDDYDLVLVVYRCDLGGAEPTCGSVAELAWASPDDLGSYAFPGADQQTVDQLVGSLD